MMNLEQGKRLQKKYWLNVAFLLHSFWASQCKNIKLEEINLILAKPFLNSMFYLAPNISGLMYLPIFQGWCSFKYYRAELVPNISGLM